MLLRYLHPILEPWRRLRGKYYQAKAVPNALRNDVRRVKAMKGRGQQNLQSARDKVRQVGQQGQQVAARGGAARQQAAGAYGAVPQAQPAGFGQPAQGGQAAFGQPGGAPPGMAQPGGAYGGQPGMGQGGAPQPGNGTMSNFKRCGFLWLKKKCGSCENRMEKGWDQCPYCNQAAAPPPPQAAPAPAPSKTQAFMLDAAGTGNSNMALLGWIIPLRGAQRGELFTLAPESLVGTDPTCTVVLIDNYMSSRHAEIKAEGGQWVLKDLGSTNGTFVNDKRIDRHELVDSDFIKFGQSLVKFKCF